MGEGTCGSAHTWIKHAYTSRDCVSSIVTSYTLRWAQQAEGCGLLRHTCIIIIITSTTNTQCHKDLTSENFLCQSLETEVFIFDKPNLFAPLSLLMHPCVHFLCLSTSTDGFGHNVLDPRERKVHTCGTFMYANQRSSANRTTHMHAHEQYILHNCIKTETLFIQ